MRVRASILSVALLLTATAVGIAVTSSFTRDPVTITVIAVSVFLPFWVAAQTGPARLDGHLFALLIALGGLYFIRSLAAADTSIVYTGARTVGQASEFVLLWLMISFPTGRLHRAARLIMIAAGAEALLWVAVVMTSPRIPLGGVFVTCDNRCPDNALLLRHVRHLSATIAMLFRWCGVPLLLAVVLLLVIRRLHATPLQRRTLTPVLLAAIARTAAVAAFLIFGSPVWETGLLILTAWCIPIAIMVGALLADSYRARALEEMVRALRARPTPAELRDMLARAVQDPSLDIAFGQAEDSGVRGVESRRATTPVTSRSGAGPVALVHDAGLLEDEQLLKSLALTTAFALERTELEAAVATARDDTASAVARERRRFERDLHDSAQQRLIAMQIKVSVARLLFERDPGAVRDVLDELQSDAAATLQEVRSVARGIAPALLTDNGLRDALTAATAEAPLSVRVDAPSARYPAVIETAIYFSCVEAVQNAAKHAGAGADVEVRIAVEGSALVFTITDDGTGFDPVATPNVGGLLNIKHRIAELGGTVSLNTKPGAGTSIRGTVPLRTPVDPRSVDYHHDDSTRDAETTANQSLRTSR